MSTMDGQPDRFFDPSWLRGFVHDVGPLNPIACRDARPMNLAHREVVGGKTLANPCRGYRLALVAGVLIVTATSAAGAAVNHRGLSGNRRRPSTVVPTGRDRSGADRGAASPVDPGLFEPGACVAFPPTRGHRHITVFLDAGHGGRDSGAIGTTRAGRRVAEANLTLPIELGTAALLRSEGFRVVVSRTRQTAVARPRPGSISGGIYTVKGATREVAARDVCANLSRADLLVGIYLDGGSSPLNAGSVTAYDAVRPFWRSNLRFADLLQADVLALMNTRGWGIPNDGVQLDSYLGGPTLSAATRYHHLLLLGPAMAGYFTSPSKMPGALIEPLFVTDPFEATIAASAAGQRVIAAGIAKAVTRYFAR